MSFKFEHEHLDMLRRGAPDRAQDGFGFLVRPIVENVAQDIGIGCRQRIVEKIAALKTHPRRRCQSSHDLRKIEQNAFRVWRCSEHRGKDMAAAAANVGNDVIAREVERGEEGCDLCAGFRRHRRVEDASLLGMITIVVPKALGNDLLGRGLSGARGMVQFAGRRPVQTAADHANEGAHGLRMVAAQQT